MLLTAAWRTSALLFLAWALTTGCTVTTGNSTQTPECRIDSALLCTGNNVGYSCQGDLKPALNCGAGSAEADGEIGYCCAASTGACVIDDAAGCTNNSTGYSCTNGVLPNSSDPTLSCGAGVSDASGNALYCCIGVTSSSCASDASVAGCTGGSYGFSCTSSDTPEQGNASLVCSAATAGPNGNSLYCCVGFRGAQGSCASDPSVAGCTGGSYGFSCTSSDTPEQTQPSLSCSTATQGPNGELLYCCSNG